MVSCSVEYSLKAIVGNGMALTKALMKVQYVRSINGITVPNAIAWYYVHLNKYALH